MSTPTFDISKYYQPFFKDESLQVLGNQIAECKVPESNGWVAVIFLFLKAAAMAAVYGMWRKNMSSQMVLDKQAYQQQINTNIHSGDNVL